MLKLLLCGDVMTVAAWTRSCRRAAALWSTRGDTAVARRIVGWPRASRGSQDDSGEPYEFVDVAQLIDDFFDEVERYMAQRAWGPR